MPLEEEKGPSYVKVTKVPIESIEREPGSRSPTDYLVKLQKEIQYVIGMEITGFDIPNTVTQSFLAQQGQTLGNNMLDFELSAGANTTKFSVGFPERKFVYENLLVPGNSYVTTLELMLAETVATDPQFGIGAPNEATFYVSPTASENTSITVTGAGITAFTLLFESGPNTKNSANAAMGFELLDYAADPATLTVISPMKVDLNTYRFVDITIREAKEHKPLERIYMNDYVNSTTLNQFNLSRTRLLTDPIHRFKEARVKLTLLNGLEPRGYDQNLEHGFVLTVFSLSNEVGAIPVWARKQFFTL